MSEKHVCLVTLLKRNIGEKGKLPGFCRLVRFVKLPGQQASLKSGRLTVERKHRNI